MAVYKDKKRGTWFVDIKYSVDGVCKNHKKRGFELKRDAQTYETHFRRSLTSDIETSIQFHVLFYEYQFSRKMTCRSSTIANSQRHYKLFLEKPIGNVRLDKITPLVIQRTLQYIYKVDRAVTYKNDAIRTFKSTLRYANNYYGTSFNLDLIKPFALKSEDVFEHEVWTNDDFTKFITYIDNPVYKAFFTFLYNTGARRGEAMALQAADLTGNRVTINKTLRTHKKGIQSTKTLTSVRSILLDKNTLKMVKELESTKFLFGNDYPLSASQIARVFNKGIEDSGVKRIRLHDLRHSHATNLINRGANIVAVSRRLGHSSTDMTLKVYTHLLERTEKELLDYI